MLLFKKYIFSFVKIYTVNSNKIITIYLFYKTNIIF
jgi:hypothetical protein